MSASQHIPDNIIPVPDLNTFAAILMDWHEAKVKTLEHMQNIPEGSEVSLNDGPAVIMTPEYRAGFAMGITVSLMELGILPFFTDESPQGSTEMSDTPA
jgi:hypothetical protein